MKRLTRVGRSLLRNLIQAVPTMFVIVTLGFFVLQARAWGCRRLHGGRIRCRHAGNGGRHSPGFRARSAAARSACELLYKSGAFQSRHISPLRCPRRRSHHGASAGYPDAHGSCDRHRPAGGDRSWHDHGTERNARGRSHSFGGIAAVLLSPDILDRIDLHHRLLGEARLATGWRHENHRRFLGGFGWLIDRASYALLPATSLALYYMAIYARLTRSSILEVIGQDHVRTAKAKGLAPRQVVLRHVLRNALIPITTVAGIHVAGILGGAIVIETVFSWPGMGRLAFDAVMAREYTLLLGIMLVSSVLVICVNAIVDIIQAALDPRIEVR